MLKRISFLLLLLFSISIVSSCDSLLPKEETPSEESNTNGTIEEEPSTDTTPDSPIEETPSEEPTTDVTPTPSGKVTLNYTGYYASLNGTVETNFKQKLHTLIETTHTNRGSYATAWTVLEACDVDPKNSNNILCIYTGQSIPKTDRASSGNGTVNWNREHVWPKSLGFSNRGAVAHNDCHHLHASEERINGYRSNSDFGEVTNPTNSDTYGNKWTSTTFEPRDEVKGDIARSIFYMVVRYDGDLCNNCELDLEVISGHANTAEIEDNQIGRIGDLETLLKWHYQDPVDDTERTRNEVVYSYQKNRNPFIDHEEFVSYLYTSLVSKYTDTSKLQYLIEN